MKLFFSATLALALSAAHAVAMAAPVTTSTNVLIDFEDVTSFSPIADALGVSFGGDALGLVNDEYSTFFTHAPSSIGVMTPVGAEAYLNVAAGFSTGLSLHYSSSSDVLNAVQIWSGLNGTGSLLASINLSNNAQAGGCSDSPYCHFEQAFAAFSGTAYSVTFGNATYAAAFDNVHVGAVPEPESLALMLAGGGVALLAVRRRRA